MKKILIVVRKPQEQLKDTIIKCIKATSEVEAQIITWEYKMQGYDVLYIVDEAIRRFQNVKIKIYNQNFPHQH